MIFNVIPLFGRITLSSGEPIEPITQRSTYNPCVDGPRHRNPGDTTTSETCPYAFYTTEVLPCNQYTLNLTVMSNQAMQINEFDFLPCQPDGDPASASASTTAPVSASSPTSVIAAAKKQTLGAGAIVGAVIGALVVLLALGSLAFFILLRRRRRMGSLPSPSLPPPSSPSSFLIFFSRSRTWLRLPGRQPKPSTPPSAEFLTPVSSSSPAAASGDRRTGQGYSTTTTFDISAKSLGSASASAALASAPETMGPAAAPMVPWSFARSAGNARGGEGGGTAVEKQPLPPDDADLEQSGVAVARGYLPDSKELMAWQEREQAGAQSGTQTSGTTEALPRYQTRGSLRRSS